MQLAEMLEGRTPQAATLANELSVADANFDLSALTPYELRHVLQHLRDAELYEEVHRVLTFSSAKGRNAWYDSLVANDLADEFTVAIALAWDCARMESRHSICCGQRSSRLGLEMRYAVITASLNSVAASIPTAIVSAALDRRLLRSVDVVLRFRQLTDFSERIQTLHAVVRHLSSAQLDEVLATADTFPPFYQVSTIAAVAPHLLPRTRDEILRRAVSVAKAIEFPSTRVQALMILTPQLQAERTEVMQMARELTAALPNPHESLSCYADLLRSSTEEERPPVAKLLGLAAESQRNSGVETHLPDAISSLAECGFPEQAEELLERINSDVVAGWAIERFAPFCKLTATQERLFKRAAAIENPYSRVSAWAALAPVMTREMTLLVLGRAENAPLKRSRSLAARLIGGVLRLLGSQSVAGMRATTASFLALEVRVATLAAMHLCELGGVDDVNKRIEALKDPTTQRLVRAVVLLEQSRHDDSTDIAPAINVLLSVDDEPWRIKFLAYIAPRCRGEHWPLLMKAASANGLLKAGAFGALLPHMANDVLLDLLTTARVGDERTLTEGLSKLAAKLPDAGGKPAVKHPSVTPSELLLSAASAADGNPEALFEVLPSLPREVQQQFAASTFIRVAHEQQSHLQSRALERLAPFMSQDTQRATLSLVRSFQLPFDRDKVLRALAPKLDPSLIGMARSISDSLDDMSREQISTLLACRLADCGDVEGARSEITHTSEVPQNRVFAVVQLLPHIPADKRQPLLDSALDDIEKLRNPDRLRYLAELAQFRALAERLEVAEECLRYDLLEPLIPLVPDLPLEKGYEIWNDRLSKAARGPRSELVGTLGELATTARHLAGNQAIAECIRAIRDAGRWWP
jgi:hypothetical protein